MMVSCSRTNSTQMLYERLSDLLKIYLPSENTELHLVKETTGARVECKYRVYRIFIGLDDIIEDVPVGIPRDVLRSIEKCVLLMHEIAHVRYTDFRLRQMVSWILSDTHNIKVEGDVIRAVRDITNIIEDSRVNYLMGRDYKGFRDGLLIVYEYGVKKKVQFQISMLSKRDKRLETSDYIHSAYLLWLFESAIYDMGLFSHYVSLLRDEDRELVFRAIKETEQYVEKALSARSSEMEASYIALIIKKLIQIGIGFPNELGKDLSFSNNLVMEFDSDSSYLYKRKQVNDDRLDDLAREFREKKLTESSNISDQVIKELSKEEMEKLKEIKRRLSSSPIATKLGPKFGCVDVATITESRKLSETLRKYLMTLFPKTKTGYKKSYTGTRVSKKLAISDKKLIKKDPRSVKKYHGYLQDPKSRNFTLILDCSGSMLGSRISAAKVATMSIMRAIENLGQKARLIAFSGDALIIKEYNDKYEERESTIASVIPDGCTELGKALEKVGENDDIVLVITDGEPTDSGYSKQLLKELNARGKKIAILWIMEPSDGVPTFLTDVSDCVTTKEIKCDAKSFSTDLVREVLNLYKELMR